MVKPDNTQLNEEMWDSRAKMYDRGFGFARWSQKKLVSFLELKGEERLLDLACGTGWSVIYAAKIKRNGEYYGVDLSSNVIEQAKRNSGNHDSVHFSKANAEELPFEHDFFDYVICANAFHHFSDPAKVVKEGHRVLKSRGEIHILDGSADTLNMRLVDRLLSKIERGHVKMYSTKEYQAFFRGAGFLYNGSKSIFGPFAKIHVGQK